MKEFFKMLGASTLGVIIGGMILFFFSFMILMGVIASFSSKPAYNLQENTVLTLDLSGTINDRIDQSPFDALFSGSLDSGQALQDILDAIKKAKDNDRIKGIYVKMGYAHSGYATLEPIRKALVDFKESGKFIVAYGEVVSQGAYYVGSTADKVFMNPQGSFYLAGLGSVRQYSKEVFKKWGVDIQVFKVGTYKSAVEPYTQTQMSEANREQVTAYLNDIWGKLLEGISESREIPVDILNKYTDEFLLFADPNKVVEYGLVDELMYGAQVESHLRELLSLNEDDKLRTATASEFLSVPDLSRKKRSKDYIAVLYAEGSIVGDEESSLYSSNNITAKQYVKELRKLKDDDDVKAVVFRVNSGGGSGYASEQIWYAVEELKAVKPVIVSMGDYAASGGYYISCGAHRIVAEHTTLTGSIGVFGMFPSGEQLSQRMGAHHDGVGTNKHSLFGGGTLEIPFLGIGLLPARPLNIEEQAMMQGYVERFYDVFLTRCADGRGMSKEEIDRIGQGRVWTGNQALSLGLVDELGGLERAIEIAAEHAGLDDYSKIYYPDQKDFLSSLLEETSSSISTRIEKAILGEEVYEQKRVLKAWKDYDIRQAVMLEY